MPVCMQEREGFIRCVQSGEPRTGRVKRSLKVPEYDPDWDPLTLDFRVEWPLHLLLSHEVSLSVFESAIPAYLESKRWTTTCCCLFAIRQ